MDSPPSEKEGCPKGGVVGREKVYSLFKKVDSLFFLPPPPTGTPPSRRRRIEDTIDYKLANHYFTDSTYKQIGRKTDSSNSFLIFSYFRNNAFIIR